MNPWKKWVETSHVFCSVPHFLNNYKRERDNDEREYYARQRREWEYRMNESNSLHNDLLLLGVPLVD